MSEADQVSPVFLVFQLLLVHPHYQPPVSGWREAEREIHTSIFCSAAIKLEHIMLKILPIMLLGNYAPILAHILPIYHRLL